MAVAGASCRWRYDLVDQQLGLPSDSGAAGVFAGQSGSPSGDGGSNLEGEGTPTAGNANLGGGGTTAGAGQSGVGGAGNAGQGGTSAGRSGVGGGGNGGQAGSSHALPTGVSTLAGTGVDGFDDGPAASATFSQPMGVLWTPEGLYVADAGNAAVRLIAPDGTVSTVVGFAGSGFVDGPLLTAKLLHPAALARDSQGRILVADNWNHAIRRIERNGTLSTVVGDGTAGYREGKGVGAQLNEPQGMWLAGDDVIYVADKNNRVIRRVAVDGTTSLFCGQPGNNAIVDGSCLAGGLLEFPTHIVGDGAGNFYVSEWGQHVVRKISPAGIITAYLGQAGVMGWADGAANTSVLSHPSEALWDSARGLLWFLDHDGGNRLRDFDGTVVTTRFGPKTPTYVPGSFADGADSRFSYPEGLALDGDGTLYIADVGNNRIRRTVSN